MCEHVLLSCGKCSARIVELSADLQVAREALEQIARCGYGIDMSDSSQDAAEYWSGQTLRLRALARSALARIKGTP